LAQVHEKIQSLSAPLLKDGKERIDLKKIETTAALTNIKNVLQKQIEEQSVKQRDVKIILYEYTTAKKKLDELKDELSTLESLSRRGDSAIEKRKQMLATLIKDLSKRLKAKFVQTLQNKGFAGKIILNHEAKTLDVEITPHNRSKIKDTSSLSGGERSFSTVCLLMSMWDVMGNSLCAMDEFDVYMDGHSRERSIDMLVKMAIENAKRQFIFISPLSISAIPKNQAKVQIIEVAPPVRSGVYQNH